MTKWLLILFTVVASSSGDVLCAKGMSRGGELTNFRPTGVIRAIIRQRLVILGWLCYASSFFALLGLLSVAQLSVAVPATALGFVLDTIAARILLRERVPWQRWIGVMCVAAGVVLTVRSGPTRPLPAGSTSTTAAQTANASGTRRR